MKKICIIGNNASGKRDFAGQVLKVRTYINVINKEGFNPLVIDLDDIKKKPLKTFISIKKAIKHYDVILLLTASRGVKLLVPYINFINKIYKKRIVYSLIGTSLLHIVLDKLNPEQCHDFLLNKNYSLIKQNKYWNKQLAKLDLILPETDVISDAYKGYFHINNVMTLVNFKENIELFNNVNRKDNNKIVFCSRVCVEKGIFDLLSAVRKCNENGISIQLDIYGSLQLPTHLLSQFNSYLSYDYINYKGTINNEDVIKTLSNYKLFVFPTRYSTEGLPGILVESLLAGVPILSSSFFQAGCILNDGFDSLLYKFNDENDLYDKMVHLLSNNELLNTLKEGVRITSSKYSYETNRERFLSLLLGD